MKQNLEEEIEAARKVSVAGKAIFREATQEKEEDKDSQPASKKSSKDKTSEQKSKQDERKAASAVQKKGTASPNRASSEEDAAA